MRPGMAKSVGALMDAVVRGELDKAQTLRLCHESPELVALALLAAAKRIAEQEARIAELQKASAEGGMTDHGINSASPITCASRKIRNRDWRKDLRVDASDGPDTFIWLFPPPAGAVR